MEWQKNKTAKAKLSNELFARDASRRLRLELLNEVTVVKVGVVWGVPRPPSHQPFASYSF